MRISVYITSFNQRELLREAIDSVLAQTQRPTQVIVVDDASSDGSQELIRQYERDTKGLVEGIFHSVNQGVTRARIGALSRVNGDFVSYVDGDDYWLPEKLAAESAALGRDGQARIAFSDVRYVRADGSTKHCWLDVGAPPQGDAFLQTLARDYPRSNLFRMELVHMQSFREVGFHDPQLKLYEDWEMRIRLTRRLRTVFAPGPARSVVREHGTGLSSATLGKHFSAIDAIWNKTAPWRAQLAEEDQRYVRRVLGSWVGHVARNEVKRTMSTQLAARERARRLAHAYWMLARFDPRGSDLRALVQLLPQLVVSEPKP